MILTEKEVRMSSFKHIVEKYPEFKELLEKKFSKITDENIEEIFENMKTDSKINSIYNKLVNISLILTSMTDVLPIKEMAPAGAMGVTGVNPVFSSAGAEPPEYMGELTTCQLQNLNQKKTVEVYKRLPFNK